MKKMDFHAMDESMLSFCSALTSAVQLIHRQVKAVQSPPSDEPCHNIHPGDWVCVREERRENPAGPNHITSCLQLTQQSSVRVVLLGSTHPTVRRLPLQHAPDTSRDPLPHHLWGH